MRTHGYYASSHPHRVCCGCAETQSLLPVARAIVSTPRDTKALAAIRRGRKWSSLRNRSLFPSMASAWANDFVLTGSGGFFAWFQNLHIVLHSFSHRNIRTLIAGPRVILTAITISVKMCLIIERD